MEYGMAVTTTNRPLFYATHQDDLADVVRPYYQEYREAHSDLGLPEEAEYVIGPYLGWQTALGWYVEIRPFDWERDA